MSNKINNILTGILKEKKLIKKENLPSRGYFYEDDFEVYIHKASLSNIKDYNENFEENISSIINSIKKITRKNTSYSKDYTFDYIKSIDMIFIFMEIVKFTNKKEINIEYFSKEDNKDKTISFGPDTFNYFNPSKELLEKYDNKNKCFNIEGFSCSTPSIGVENSLVDFLLTKLGEMEKYNNYFHDFTYFVGNKPGLELSEVNNLFELFNNDLSKKELENAKKAILEISPFQKYSLMKDNKIINIESKIKLNKIWS